MMPSSVVTFQTVSAAWRSSAGHDMRRLCAGTGGARAAPCGAWAPLIGVARHRRRAGGFHPGACGASEPQRRTVSSPERIVSGDNAVSTAVPHHGRAAALIQVAVPADDQGAQSQQLAMAAVAEAARMNSSARHRRRAQRQRCAWSRFKSDVPASHRGPPPSQAPEPRLVPST